MFYIVGVIDEISAWQDVVTFMADDNVDESHVRFPMDLILVEAFIPIESIRRKGRCWCQDNSFLTASLSVPKECGNALGRCREF